MGIYRIRFDVKGEHVHCNLFYAKAQNMTFAKCGDFATRRGEEFCDLMRQFPGADFISVEGGAGVSSACNTEDEAA